MSEARFCSGCGEPLQATVGLASGLRAARPSEIPAAAEAATGVPSIPEAAPIAGTGSGSTAAVIAGLGSGSALASSANQSEEGMAQSEAERVRAMRMMAEAAERKLEEVRTQPIETPEPYEVPEPLSIEEITASLAEQTEAEPTQTEADPEHVQTTAEYFADTASPPPPPPVDQRVRWEAERAQEAEVAREAPISSEEIEVDTKKLGSFCGWGCAILAVLWVIGIIIMFLVRMAG